jgi:hypothetical protein
MRADQFASDGVRNTAEADPSPESPAPAGDRRAREQKAGAVVVGLASLLITGPTAAGPAAISASAANDSMAAQSEASGGPLAAQFTDAFTPGAADPAVVNMPVDGNRGRPDVAGHVVR